MAIALIVLAILFSVYSALRPFRIGRLHITIATGPLLALCILFAAQIITLETVSLGLLGTGSLRPWEILVIFFTVAYVSISLDLTGILDFFAYRIVDKARGSGIKLFVFFYAFSCALTVFTSNDIVILTLTPIIFYLGRHAKLNVVPLLVAEFFGANTMSMLLYIGNPTNSIVGNALGLSFMEYTRVMWLPALSAGLANLALLYMYFRKDLTRRFEKIPASRYTVRNWADAVLSCTLMVLMLGFLAASQSLGMPIWSITAAAAAVFILEDLAFGAYYTLRHKALPDTALVRTEEEIFRLYGIPEHRNDFWITIKRIPWKILPFITVFFILVAGLYQHGAVDAAAAFISGFARSTGSSIAANGSAAFVLANMVNNQPMTILFSSILISEQLLIPGPAFQAAAYAVVIASNLGANLTLIGALAGLMWKTILKTKGMTIRYRDFFKAGICITPPVFALTLLVLYLVLL
jgi:arsenical pump membrane protein